MRRGSLLATVIVSMLAAAGASCESSHSIPDAAGLAPDARTPPDAPLVPDAAAPIVPREIDGRITINELMASNALTALGDGAPASPWVELWNPTDRDISLDGYALTNDLDEPRRGQIGAGVVLPARGHVVLRLDVPSAAGGELGLARPDGSYIDRVRYGAQETDFSAAREPDGSDLWVIEWHPSPGAANLDRGGRPMGIEVLSVDPEAVPAAGDLSERILGYDVLLELTLIVSPAAAAALEADPTTSVPALLVYDGRPYGPVGLRVKGQNSFEPFSRKPSLRILVNQYTEAARFFGLKDLTLNNMHSDFSMVHERLSYWVAREIGLPASRANHAFLTVNQEPYGLYTNVETVKHRMIARWFADDSGPLFEATDVDFEARYLAAYELESGPDDRTLLAAFAAALALPSADAAIAAAAQVADLDQLRRYWAMCAVVGQLDAFPYSDPGDDYFVYADPRSAKLAVLPWGMDETFYAGNFDVTQTRSVFARRCLESPRCRQAWVDEVWAVQAMTEAMGLERERLRVIEQIAPYAALDTRKWYTAADVASYQTALYWFIRERRSALGAMLAPSP